MLSIVRWNCWHHCFFILKIICIYWLDNLPTLNNKFSLFLCSLAVIWINSLSVEQKRWHVIKGSLTIYLKEKYLWHVIYLLNFNISLCYRNLQFVNLVIIIKTKVLLQQAYIPLADFCYEVYSRMRRPH
jgi:hypothetical protein